MNAGDSYRALAAELSAKAKLETGADLAFEMENLALAYRRLAEQADRNSMLSVDLMPSLVPDPLRRNLR